MRIFASDNSRDNMTWKMMHKSMDDNLWVLVSMKTGYYTWNRYFLVETIHEVKPNGKQFIVECQCIDQNHVDDYHFEGEEIWPSSYVSPLVFENKDFDLVYPIETYTDAEMQEILSYNDIIYREGYHDWWGVYPRERQW